ncbi:Thioesterase/thiol ester dehydrase-isomerase [Cryphonectria parasitica EP155]|uniref:Thioesterase/thiol ester dehydrase-isomerase n=1 Tax=Cryphonectria parasitica (strain ATCC 38755 / EP155) TaxID=660469 RepID=A0A9P4XZU8_CRYP1|nr:Thioesterase/thiol ester dehydrase-isomerase [Cryphonectria parasitica EP155]KAF3763810.1 Thioesterase/thiol ester dehydrase-isomerase [Cryphonectria parasitica EP155]
MAGPTPPVESTATDEPVSVLDHVSSVWSHKIHASQPYALLIPTMRITSATSDGRVTGEMVLEPSHVNSLGGIHGTTSAAIIDFSAGMAIVARSGGEKTGVSTDIHASYVSSARVGDTIEVECWLNKLGRSMAFTSVEIRKKDGEGEGKGSKKKVLVTGSHTKFVA